MVAMRPAPKQAAWPFRLSASPDQKTQTKKSGKKLVLARALSVGAEESVHRPESPADEARRMLAVPVASPKR